MYPRDIIVSILRLIDDAKTIGSIRRASKTLRDVIDSVVIRVHISAKNVVITPRFFAWLSERHSLEEIVIYGDFLFYSVPTNTIIKMARLPHLRYVHTDQYAGRFGEKLIEYLKAARGSLSGITINMPNLDYKNGRLLTSHHKLISIVEPTEIVAMSPQDLPYIAETDSIRVIRLMAVKGAVLAPRDAFNSLGSRYEYKIGGVRNLPASQMKGYLRMIPAEMYPLITEIDMIDGLPLGTAPDVCQKVSPAAKIALRVQSLAISDSLRQIAKIMASNPRMLIKLIVPIAPWTLREARDMIDEVSVDILTPEQLARTTVRYI